MNTFDFGQITARRKQVLEIAGEYLPMLDTMPINEWLEEIKKCDPETAEQLRRYIAVVEGQSDPQHRDRMANIESAMSEVNAPLYAEVDRGVPAHAKGLDRYKSREELPRSWQGAEDSDPLAR